MKTYQTALERAFEIARTGVPTSIEDIRRQLAREGYDQRQIEGLSLTRQLMEVTRNAREKAQGQQALPNCVVRKSPIV